MFLILLMIVHCSALFAATHKDQFGYWVVPVLPCIAPSSITKADAALQQEKRDQKRLKEHTIPNIKAIQKTLPKHLSSTEKAMLTCYRLSIWDARIAYDNELIPYDPERLIVISTALAPLHIRTIDHNNQITETGISITTLYAMNQEEARKIVRPTACVEYLLDLQDEARNDALNAHRLHAILEPPKILDTTTNSSKNTPDHQKPLRSRSSSLTRADRKQPQQQAGSSSDEDPEETRRNLKRFYDTI